MNKKVLISIAFLGILAIGGIYWFATKKETKTISKEITINPEFSNYIASFTFGTISSVSNIKVRFTQPFESMAAGMEETKSIFTFSPSIKGKTVWENKSTLVFMPDTPLLSGEEYKVSVDLKELYPDIPEDLSSLEYGLSVLQQSIDFSVQNIAAYDNTNLKRQKITGEIIAADFISLASLQSAFLAEQNNKALQVNWQVSSDNTQFKFAIENVARTEEKEEVSVKIDGAALGANNEVEESIEIPALGDFSIRDIRVIQSEPQYIEVLFSDPLLEDQDLDGLIEISGYSNADFSIEGNKAILYPKNRPSGKRTITVSKSVKNVMGFVLQEGVSRTISFEQMKPNIELSVEGNILPSSKGLILPFRAVSLKAVEVKVIKIMEQNMLQFLQVNDLSGQRELRRVGKPVLKKTINLRKSGVADLGKWNDFVLDLEDLIRPEPGAIYQVQLSFKQHHAAFHCGGQQEDGLMTIETADNWEPQAEQENSYWDNYEDYYYNEEYDWNERENPCHATYYMRKQPEKINVLASNIGLIVKKGEDNSCLVVSTDLRTTKPLQGVKIEFLNYQMESLFETTSDAEGFATYTAASKPYFVVASLGGEKAYVKLVNGKALSVSGFDVGGTKIKKGIKGFLYAERGVWRPGDSIFHTFIIKDPGNKIPENHPVIYELKNPKGKVVRRLVKTNRVGNMYRFTTTTDEKSPTGNWTASVSIGGTAFSENVKIETVKPNRLKINADFGKEKIVLSEGDIKGTIGVDWLHGATGAGLRTTVDLILKEKRTTFNKFDGFQFDDPTRLLYSERYSVYDGITDGEGEARFSYSLNKEFDAPGVVNARFITKAFETGGNYSIDAFSVPMYTYEAYNGMKKPKGDKKRGMLLTDTTQVVQLVNVTPEGKLKPNSNFDVEVYKIKWKWWWDKSEENLTNYVNGNYYKPIISKSIDAPQGKADFKFEIKYPEWGRYLIRSCNGEGHCTAQIAFIDWPGWAGRAQRDNPDGAAMLSFNSDADAYNVGDKVEITIPGSNKGRALVTVENGSRVLGNWWVETQEGDNKFSFDVTKSMTPNIYVHAMLLQPHQNNLNDYPMRMYGILPLEVSDPATKISPKLSIPTEVEPGDKMAIQVSEANGNPMRYTVAVVDEGLLDLTRFKTPEPWKHFYAKEALGVKTWDIYDAVIGAYNGNLSRLLALGGDGEAGAQEEDNKRFETVVKYFGPFELEQGDKQTHSFVMPQYVGSVKVMVVAEKDDAFGHADGTTKVKQSLMALGTLPRVLGVEETVDLPVNLFITDGKHSNVAIDVALEGGLTFAGKKSKKVNVAGKEHAMAYFSLTTPGYDSEGKVIITAKSKGKVSRHEINISIRNPNPYTSKVSFYEIPPGETKQIEWQPFGAEKTNSALIEVSSFPIKNLDNRLKYLIRYPYGCLEQTVSSVLPQLFVKNFMQLESASLLEIDNNINAGIDRLKMFQGRNGGFSYWPGSENVNHWANSYAGYFLITAEKHGYPVPYQMKKDWFKFQKRSAKNWRKKNNTKWDTYIQAFRLFTLAYGNQPERSAMNRLRERTDLTTQARLMLAWAYAIIGEGQAATQLMLNQETNFENYQTSSATYGSQIRDEAITVLAFTAQNRKKDVKNIVDNIADKLAQPKYWMSTQTTAFSLQAIAAYYQNAAMDVPMKFRYSINEEEESDVNALKPIFAYPIKVEEKSKQGVSLENYGKNTLFVTLSSSGQPLVGKELPQQENIILDVRYTDKNGNAISPKNIEQGTEFYAIAEIANPGVRGYYENLALTQVFPSGWEIQNARLFEGTTESQATYQDIRDDRVNTFFDLKPGERKEFKIKLNASYKGSYYLPAIKVEAMYDNSIIGVLEGQSVKVE